MLFQDLIRDPAKVEIPSRRKWILSSDRDKIVFRMFTRKETVFGKTNHSPFCFSLRPTYEQNMSEIDFLTCATKS